MKIVLKKYQNT